MISVPVEYLDIFTVSWLFLWALYSLRKLASDGSLSIHWVIIVHALISGLPLALNMLIGHPEYIYEPGFVVATADYSTSVLYNLYVCFVPVVFYALGRPRQSVAKAKSILIGERSLFLLRHYWGWLVLPLISPMVFVAFSPDPAVYREYAVTLTQDLSDAQIAYHSLISLTSRLSVGTAAILLLITPKVRFGHLAFVAPWVAFSIYVNGKRSIVAMAIVLALFVLWQKGMLRSYKLVLAGAIAVLAMAAFSLSYQTNIRDIGAGQDTAETYRSVRVDYGRDAQIKMTLYSELNPGKMRILEHRGQSLLFYVTMYIPRDQWPEKPLPYAQYFTSAMFFAEPQFWGWGMTTSWLGEAVSNFGWVGLVVGPAVPALICRASDARGGIAVRGLGVLISILLLFVAADSFMPLIVLWLLLTWRSAKGADAKLGRPVEWQPVMPFGSSPRG